MDLPVSTTDSGRDVLSALQILIVLAAIVLGARLGLIAIGFAGGLGVLLLGLTGVPVSREDIPFDVIGIIMAVMGAIAAMQRAGGILQQTPWMLTVVLFIAAALLYSQAATTQALMPAALAIGVSPLTALAAFPAVSALFALPTYPTLLAAAEMDVTCPTRIGKFVFNHPFLIGGVLV